MRLCTLFILCEADKWYTLCDVIYNVVPNVYQLLWYVFVLGANLQDHSNNTIVTKTCLKLLNNRLYLM